MGFTRRRLLGSGIGTTAFAVMRPLLAQGRSSPAPTRTIPSTGEAIPVVGLGTWITFNAGRSNAAHRRLLPVLQTFFDRGGRLIDSSPMYNSSEYVVGQR